MYVCSFSWFIWDSHRCQAGLTAVMIVLEKRHDRLNAHRATCGVQGGRRLCCLPSLPAFRSRYFPVKYRTLSSPASPICSQRFLVAKRWPQSASQLTELGVFIENLQNLLRRHFVSARAARGVFCQLFKTFLFKKKTGSMS